MGKGGISVQFWTPTPAVRAGGSWRGWGVNFLLGFKCVFFIARFIAGGWKRHAVWRGGGGSPFTMRECQHCTNRTKMKNLVPNPGGATTNGPDATTPPAICQNSGGGGSWGGGVRAGGRGGGVFLPGVGGASGRGVRGASSPG